MSKRTIKAFFENVQNAIWGSDDGVSRAKVETVEVPRAKVKRALVNADGKQLTKIRYTDTNEVVVVDTWDRKVFDELMTNGRPIEVIGYAYEEES